MVPRLDWKPLVVNGAHNAALREALRDASGAYAVRVKRSGSVVYVGVSAQGVMWKTITRHFNAPETFKAPKPKGGGNSFAVRTPGDYEIAYRVTSRGARTVENRDERALALESRWIADFYAAGEPLKNDQIPADADDFAFGANVKANPGLVPPAGHLTELGILTRLETARDVFAWNLRDAPVLAYDTAGRLFVVYAAKVVRASSPDELREYARTHWGAKGCGDCSDGRLPTAPFVAAGRGTSITYTTRKGSDRKLVDYVHAWGEGGPRKFTAPGYVVHECGKPRCPWNGAMALVGGSYTVSERGIVG